LQQDQTKVNELYARAAELGFSKAHYNLADDYHNGGDLKKAKFHFEVAAMAGHEVARYNLGLMEYESGKKKQADKGIINLQRAIEHWRIGANAGCHIAMNSLQIEFKRGYVSQDAINSTLKAYNNACAEMRSKARDDCPL
jgi:TPR repeat protein